MDYQGNSKKSKEEKKKPEKVVEKVVIGEVVTRPMPLGTKFRRIFLGGEAKDAGRYVLDAVLLPAFRNLVYDVMSKGTERVLYGESRVPRRMPEYRPRVTYNNPVQRSSYGEESRQLSRSYANLPDQVNRKRPDNNQVILSNRDEAETVLERLLDIINQYDVASVADLYDLVGLSTTHIDNKWGWTFLAGVDIRQTREGYLIDLPPAEPI